MINYRLVQDKSSNPRKSGKWYAKAVIGQTVTTDQIADRIQKNCSMKKSDVVAVLSELAEVIADIVKESQRAQLDGIGCFKAGLSKCELEYMGEVETITVDGKKKIILHRPSGEEEEG